MMQIDGHESVAPNIFDKDAAIKGTDKGILWAVIASPNVQKAHEFTESCFFFFCTAHSKLSEWKGK